MCSYAACADRPAGESACASGFSDDPEVTRHRPFEISTYL
jgi:hypothetical protein